MNLPNERWKIALDSCESTVVLVLDSREIRNEKKFRSDDFSSSISFENSLSVSLMWKMNCSRMRNIVKWSDDGARSWNGHQVFGELNEVELCDWDSDGVNECCKRVDNDGLVQLRQVNVMKTGENSLSKFSSSETFSYFTDKPAFNDIPWNSFFIFKIDWLSHLCLPLRKKEYEKKE